MSQKTQIQWTDATWNIARGCTKVDADCKYCYMYRDSMDNTRYNPLQVVRTKTVFDMPLKYKETKSKCWDGRPLIFTCSLTDFFHEDIDSYRQEAWDIIKKCPHLIFQILTKRPERIMDCLPHDWGEGWENVWLGTSVGSSHSAKRIYDLTTVKSKMLFLSLEPLHGKIDLPDVMSHIIRDEYTPISWVIVGGESGNDIGKYKYRPCELNWIENIVNSCQRNNVPVFVKQMGTYLAKQLNFKNDRHGGDINQFPSHLQIRQFPPLK